MSWSVSIFAHRPLSVYLCDVFEVRTLDSWVVSRRAVWACYTQDLASLYAMSLYRLAQGIP